MPSPSLSSSHPRLLIVGGSGRLGRLIAAAWARAPEGPPVTPIWQARRDLGLGGPIFDPLEAPEAFARACAQSDAVLFLAGRINGPPAALEINVALARAARAQALRAGVPLIMASSAAVYGRGAGLLSETAPCAPLNDYGRSKLAVEAVLEGMARGCALRIGNVAGADALLGAPAPPEGRKLHVFTDGSAPRRSYIGPSALADAVAHLACLAVAQPETLPACLNLAQPGAVGMDELLSAAGESWSAQPAPPTAIAHVELDVTRAVNLGLVAPAPLDAQAMVEDMQRVKQEIQ
ncbi:NAD-dependent dehydratase [Thioclava dalianensis]|uniref:NAD-dependent dehydratase n=1 Tax=Thioclava dalianensis TaxID=1185766 RepID=A0A074TG89_9RHOB|nr:NAD-dependent epimerase/dehydratase family protein [Thioclava dalianensis]KEP69145.1 NAD-dependent dehydratase [Thioclava dalianensis]SFM91082.1 NAD dependent epimerase/dehydratase family protein [Thioclava dalianensis]